MLWRRLPRYPRTQQLPTYYCWNLGWRDPLPSYIEVLYCDLLESQTDLHLVSFFPKCVFELLLLVVLVTQPWRVRHRKHRFKHFLCCCVLILCYRNAFNAALPSNSRLYSFHYFGFQSSFHSTFKALIFFHNVMFWVVMRCSFVGGYKYFGGTCYLHLQGQRV
jgi:hypothetical protein